MVVHDTALYETCIAGLRNLDVYMYVPDYNRYRTTDHTIHQFAHRLWLYSCRRLTLVSLFISQIMRWHRCSQIPSHNTVFYFQFSFLQLLLAFCNCEQDFSRSLFRWLVHGDTSWTVHTMAEVSIKHVVLSCLSYVLRPGKKGQIGKFLVGIFFIWKWKQKCWEILLVVGQLRP